MIEEKKEKHECERNKLGMIEEKKRNSIAMIEDKHAKENQYNLQLI
jgi:hypothetical protein